MVGRRAAQLLLFLAATRTFAQDSPTALTTEQVNNVKARLGESAEASWEIGTRAQALIELDTPSFSVFTPSSVPPPTTAPESLTPVLTIAHDVVRASSNSSGPRPLMPDGSAADPVSIAISVLIANWTGYNGGSGGRLDYAGAADDQLDFLLQRVPRRQNGAISHRVAEPQLWSDYISMVPPFLAYYGVLTSNSSFITLAFDQVRAYRETLRDPQTGLWRHIVGNGEVSADPGFWSTGNAWATHGILRTIATIRHSAYSDQFSSERNQMAEWVKEIFDGMYKTLGDNSPTTHLFPNYVTDNSSFRDAAGTTLLAASVYRSAVLTGDTTWLSAANQARTSITTTNIDSSGWLHPVVNPRSFGTEGEHSPEGQAFVLMMHAAYTQWTAANGTSENGVVGRRAFSTWGAVAGMGFGVAVMVL